MDKKIVNEICIAIISILNLFNIVSTTDSRLRIVSVIIAIVCLFYYYHDFTICNQRSNNRRMV